MYEIRKNKTQVPAARFIDNRSYFWSLYCSTSGLSYYSLCCGWETADQRAILHSAFFFLLLNRQRKNSTGNASHHILSWWMCWPRPCMSCSQPLTVSLCLPLHLITHGKNSDGGSDTIVILQWIKVLKVKKKICNHFKQHLIAFLIRVCMCVFCVNQSLFTSWGEPASGTSSWAESVLTGPLDSSQCKHHDPLTTGPQEVTVSSQEIIRRITPCEMTTCFCTLVFVQIHKQDIKW